MELFFGLLLLIGLAGFYGIVYVLNGKTAQPVGCLLAEQGCSGCAIGARH